MQQLDDVEHAPGHVGRRGRAAGVLEQHAVVAEEMGVLQGREDAAVGVDAGEQQRGDAALAQQRVELVVPEAAQAMLVHREVVRRHHQLLDHPRAPRALHQRGSAVDRRDLGIAHALGRALALEMHRRRQVGPVGADAPVEPQHRAAGIAPGRQQPPQDRDRPARGADAQALLREPALGVAEVVLHVDHHQRAARQVELDRLRRRVVQPQGPGRDWPAHEADPAVAQCPGVVGGGTERRHVFGRPRHLGHRFGAAGTAGSGHASGTRTRRASAAPFRALYRAACVAETATVAQAPRTARSLRDRAP